MAKKKAKRPPRQAGIRMTVRSKRDGKQQLMKEHAVTLTALEVIALVDAANFAANRGFDDVGNWLRFAFNALLDQCGLDCEYTDGGRMIVVLPPPKKGK